MQDEGQASYSTSLADLVAVPLQVLLVAGTLVPYVLLWGWPSLENGLGLVFTLRVILPVFLAGGMAHEVLHAVGFRVFGQVARQDLRFLFIWRALMPAVHCRAAVTARAYRMSVALPGIVTGIVPAAAGIGVGAAWLTLIGVFFLTTAAGDLLVLLAIRRLPAETQVIDHPTRVGCRVAEGVAGS